MTEYEYAVQWRWDGDGEWDVHKGRFYDERGAKNVCDSLKAKYRTIETRIVRRPIVKWEVVK